MYTWEASIKSSSSASSGTYEDSHKLRVLEAALIIAVGLIASNTVQTGWVRLAFVHAGSGATHMPAIMQPMKAGPYTKLGSKCGGGGGGGISSVDIISQRRVGERLGTAAGKVSA